MYWLAIQQCHQQTMHEVDVHRVNVCGGRVVETRKVSMEVHKGGKRS